MSEVPPRNALNLWKNGAVALALEGTDGQARMLGEHNPLPVAFAPGAASDPDSAREVTLQQVLTALLALGGNTDGLEAVAAQQKAVLDQLAAYSDGVEGLLGTLSGNTDGIEGLLSSLGLKDDNVLAKLGEILAKDEQIRVLLAAQAARTETQPVSAAALPLPTGASTEATLAAQKAVIDAMKARLDLLASEAKLEQLRVLLAALPLPAGASTSALQTSGNTTLASILAALQAALPLPTGASTSALQTAGNTILSAIQAAVQSTMMVKLNPDNSSTSSVTIATGASTNGTLSLGNRTLVAVTFGAGVTANSFYFEHSVDGGTTWSGLTDGYGNAYQYVGASGRTVKLPPADFARLGLVRMQLGTPGAPVVQTANLSVTFTLAFL